MIINSNFVQYYCNLKDAPLFHELRIKTKVLQTIESINIKLYRQNIYKYIHIYIIGLVLWHVSKAAIFEILVPQTGASSSFSFPISDPDPCYHAQQGSGRYFSPCSPMQETRMEFKAAALTYPRLGHYSCLGSKTTYEGLPPSLSSPSLFSLSLSDSQINTF